MIPVTQNEKSLLQIFIAGASLSFGLPFLLIEVISLIVGAAFFTTYKDLFGALYITLYVFGGLVGGALVSQHVEMKKISSAGVTNGLLAFMLQQVISFLFFGAGVLGDTYPMFALIGGSIFGSILTRQNRKKLEKEAAEKAKKEAEAEESPEEPVEEA